MEEVLTLLHNRYNPLEGNYTISDNLAKMIYDSHGHFFVDFLKNVNHDNKNDVIHYVISCSLNLIDENNEKQHAADGEKIKEQLADVIDFKN